ncbi:MAG: pyridoxamine 5'-phosphate oxidase family protein [Anaerolineae bacterium]|nr:pyridoxamine 5'-phosphate oxidase family protein [Anaerolineae bacterium]
MSLIENWSEIKALFKRSFRSSFHYAIATVSESGEPHITPIGSLILGKPGRGVYFEEFPRQLPRNLEGNQQVCVMAVDSGVGFWLKSLLRGKFASPPAVRLYGKAGELRPATEKEIQRWQRRVRRVRFTKGHTMMWKKMRMGREVEFTRIEPVHMGEMTENLWK